MMTELTPSKIKQILNGAIKAISTSPEKYVKQPGIDFTRNRKLSFETMIKMLVGMGGNTICKELYDWFEYATDTASTSAFVQQREKILPQATEDLFHLFVDRSNYNKHYCGYRLLAADGSDLRLPANANDTESYFKNDSEDAKGYNLIHLDAIYDLLSNTYVDASMQSKRTTSEHRALVTMVDRSNIKEKSIIVADRGYESYNNMAHIEKKGWFFVIRAKESFGIITKTVLANSEEFDVQITITLTRRQTKLTRQLMSEDPSRYRWVPPHATFDFLQHKDEKMYDLNLRVVRFLIADGKYETIYTNLDKEQFPASAIKQIYNMRWGIETSFRELKYTIGLANIHSKKPRSIMQEVFARLVLYNFSQMIASLVKLGEEKMRRTNFVVAVQLCRRFLRKKIPDDELIREIARHTTPIRPNRVFTRYQAHTYAIGFAYRVQ